MIRRFLVLATLVAVLAGSLSAPASVLGEGPIDAQAPPTDVPPLRTDGPVTLPDGRVLPVEPVWVQESSAQAEMLAAHAGDRITFVPGDTPQPLDAPNATLGLAIGATNRITPLALAPASGTSATLAASATLPNGMRKEVLGFLPYWMLDAGSLQWMQYQLVTTIAYFGVAAQSDGTLATTSGGSPTAGWGGWNSSAMTGVINAAHSRGVRVVLTITMMAWDGGAGQAALLGSETARGLLISNIVAAVRDRTADGVNLDFEPVSTPLRDQYTSFVRQLKSALVAASVGSYLTVDTTGGAATWASGYDLIGLTASGAADAVFVMGYDYSWSGSSRAGGVAPMESPYILDVGESVNDYLSVIPGDRIIWGVPYYGRTWQTTSEVLNAPTRSGASGASKAYSYTGARDLAAAHGRLWDDVGKVPWFTYYDTPNATWVEGYYEDATSLAYKFDMVNARGLAGTGMWTLLMDQGDNALWDLLAAEFAPSGTTTYSPPVELTFKAGGHTGYTFNSAGAVTGSKSYTLGADSGASTSSRGPIPNQPGNWFYVTNGIWAGYWLQESSALYLASAPPAPPAGTTTYSPPVALTFKAGGHTGYTFNSAGAVTGLKSYTLGADSGASTSSRGPIPNQPGNWFYVTNGIWAGYWLQESSALYLASAPPAPPAGTTTYSPPVALTFKAGGHTGYTFNSAGSVTGAKSYSLAADSGASTSTRASLPNQPGNWFYVTNGIWAGYWLPESASLYLASS